MNDHQLARSLAEVPPQLQQPFAEAIQAWKKFTVQDGLLKSAVNEEIVQISGGETPANRETDGQVLGSDNLHWYLYPWIGPTARVPSSSYTGPASTGDRLGMNPQNIFDKLVTKAKASPSRALAFQLLRTLQTWTTYRDASCRLTGIFQRGGGSANQGQNTDQLVTEAQCLSEFNKHVEQSASKVLEDIRRRKAALTADLPIFDRQGAKLHYLYMYGRGKPDQPAPQDVTITDSSAPLIVVLESYASTEWNIQIGDGVQIRQLLLVGYQRPSYKLEIPVANIRAYSVNEGNFSKVWGYLSKGQRSRLDLRDALEEMLGLVPSTMQFGASEPSQVIDGKRTWTYVSKSEGRGPVTWTIRNRTTRGRLRVSGDEPVDQTVIASEGRSQGKWYFEVRAEPLPTAYQYWAGGTVGVIDPSKDNEWFQLLYETSFTAGSARQILPGSTALVALDLDNSFIYYGLNGKWLVGNPLSSSGGVALKRGRDYIPALYFYNLGNRASDLKVDAAQVFPGSWVGRFKSEDLEYRPPAGYKPYDSQ